MQFDELVNSKATVDWLRINRLTTARKITLDLSKASDGNDWINREGNSFIVRAASDDAAFEVRFNDGEDDSFLQPEVGKMIRHPFYRMSFKYAAQEGKTVTIWIGWALEYSNFKDIEGNISMKHTDLTEKEVDGVIDHADGSITPVKLTTDVPGTPGQIPTINEGEDGFTFVDPPVIPDAGIPLPTTRRHGTILPFIYENAFIAKDGLLCNMIPSTDEGGSIDEAWSDDLLHKVLELAPPLGIGNIAQIIDSKETWEITRGLKNCSLSGYLILYSLEQITELFIGFATKALSEVDVKYIGLHIASGENPVFWAKGKDGTSEATYNFIPPIPLDTERHYFKIETTDGGLSWVITVDTHTKTIVLGPSMYGPAPEDTISPIVYLENASEESSPDIELEELYIEDDA